MKLTPKKTKTPTWVAMIVVGLVPMAFGGGPASATHPGGFTSVEGTSSGLEFRNSVPKTEGRCKLTQDDDPATTQPEPEFYRFTAKASYSYPLSGTATVGVATITGTDSGTPHTNRSFTGPVDVSWSAPVVWDGPKGTTQAASGSLPPATPINCQWGYRWAITDANITSVVSSGLSCTNEVDGTGTSSMGVTAGSYYSRPATSGGNLGGEVVRLEFSSCTLQGGTINNAKVTLYDRAHGGCIDANVILGGIGVSHCESNYVLS